MTTPAANPSQIPSIMATLVSYEGMFGPYHPHTLGLTTILAIALCESGRTEEGRPLLQRALLDLTKHHRRNHPARIRALQAWSDLLSENGDINAALIIQRELAAIS